jgi:hypothetical protein
MLVSSIRNTVLTLAAAAALVSAPAHAGATKLTLINGWKTSSLYVKPGASAVHGIVRLQGAIHTEGASKNPFLMPVQYRPAKVVYVPVDMCNAHNGRLVIYPSGSVDVDSAGDFDTAKCFVSLDGVTFASSADGFKNLSLKNGWSNYSSDTAAAAAHAIDGIVHLQGAIKTGGSDSEALTLPKALRPAKTVYAKADLCEAANGRIRVLPTGAVTVQAQSDFTSAQCFTSLDGISFATNSSGFSPVALINGWANYSPDTAAPAVKLVSGMVVFQGAIATTGTIAQAFILPVGMRPAKFVYIPIDMWGSQNGRILVAPNGTVTVEAENGFDGAKGFVSLEGVSFHL